MSADWNLRHMGNQFHRLETRFSFLYASGRLRTPAYDAIYVANRFTQQSPQNGTRLANIAEREETELDVRANGRS